MASRPRNRPAIALTARSAHRDGGVKGFSAAHAALDLQSLVMEPLFVILAVVAVFALILGRIADRRTGARPASVGRSPARTGNRAAYKEEQADALVRACFGDRAKAERLARFEKRKVPGISDEEARRRALDRLTADRGR